MDNDIISFDFGGRHNADIEKSASRVMQSATWKTQRVIVIQPAASTIPTLVHLAHWNLIFPPNQAMFKMLAQGTEVGRAYSEAIDQILTHPELSQWEYILTLEHDNTPPSDGILKLIETLESHPEYMAVSGLYWCKGEGGCAHIWGNPIDAIPNYRPQIPVPGKIQECCGISMGFALWRLEIFKDKKIEKPFFETQASANGVGTQDLAFWGKARKLGYRCAVDNRVTVGHYDHSTGIIW
jgi:hypothetical protein